MGDVEALRNSLDEMKLDSAQDKIKLHQLDQSSRSLDQRFEQKKYGFEEKLTCSHGEMDENFGDLSDKIDRTNSSIEGIEQCLKLISGQQLSTGGQVGPSFTNVNSDNGHATAKDTAQRNFKVLSKAYASVELPPEYVFNDSGVSNVESSDRKTYFVLK